MARTAKFAADKFLIKNTSDLIHAKPTQKRKHRKSTYSKEHLVYKFSRKKKHKSSQGRRRSENKTKSPTLAAFGPRPPLSPAHVPQDTGETRPQTLSPSRTGTHPRTHSGEAAAGRRCPSPSASLSSPEPLLLPVASESQAPCVARRRAVALAASSRRSDPMADGRPPAGPARLRYRVNPASWCRTCRSTCRACSARNRWRRRRARLHSTAWRPRAAAARPVGGGHNPAATAAMRAQRREGSGAAPQWGEGTRASTLRRRRATPASPPLPPSAGRPLAGETHPRRGANQKR